MSNRALLGEPVKVPLEPVVDVRRVPVGGWEKRALDLTIAALALVALLPLFLLIAILLKLEGRGPVFYGDTRVGCGTKSFRCWKFRTMTTDADGVLAALLEGDPSTRAEGPEHRELGSDPRVTVVGAALRRMSLDELPQLWNVLRGEMSLVGPRPVGPAELTLYGADVGYYLACRPGITGAWQVSSRNGPGYAQRIDLDRAYVANWSFTTDLLILCQTPRAAWTAKGAQ